MKKQAKIYEFSLEKEPKVMVLPDEVFGVRESEKLIAEAAKVFLANQRRSRAKVKTRGEVFGSGKKIWRQKGTGRARHGDRYAPIFVGGGIAHGPTGDENRKLNLPRKKKAKALSSCLSQKLTRGEIIFVNNFKKIEGKTKIAVNFLRKLLEKAVDLKAKSEPKILLVYSVADEQLRWGVKNIDWVDLVPARNLNSYQILANKYLLIEEAAIEILTDRVKASNKV